MFRMFSGIAKRATPVLTSAMGVSSTPSLATTLGATATRALSTAGSKGKVVLLYSGGLDTTTILLWLKEQGYDVHAYIADLGQEEDFDAAREKALKVGASKVHVEDLREDFLKSYIYPAIQANIMYENLYLCGTSLARPCIAKRAVEIANEEGCDFVAHGATGKGNDQVRFELSFLALQPELTCIAPWRDPAFFERFAGRQDLLDYAAANGLEVVQTKAKPYSMDENMLHISYEAGILEDPATEPPADMFRMTTAPEDAPDTPEYVSIDFEQGIPVRITNESDGKVITDGLEGFLYLNQLGGKHGVGRVDVVENRFVGIKSRGIYETPGGELLRTAHVGVEGLTLDREVFRLRDMVGAKFADSVYNGFWFSPEMEWMLSAIDKSQERVTGRATLKLYKGHASIVGRESPLSLYDQKLSSMDEQGGYNPRDAEGFIHVNSIRLKAHTRREQGLN
jgi:argininosuccinate synthase